MAPRLTKDLLAEGFMIPSGLGVGPYPENLPERVIQFGEGNFLRAFVDWMFHKMNKEGLFNGRVVVVQPLSQGLVKQLNEQDGLYTLMLRGLRNGQAISEEEIISSISRGINPYTEWVEYLKCAENPELEFVVSNTTEAGITFDSHDRPEDAPPASFPAKLAVFLYHRFKHFTGDPQKGMVVMPCELIDRNGDHLREVILKLAEVWEWPSAFQDWLVKHNYFVNTLVDRVVPGYPKDEIEEISDRLGYEDQLLDTGELFHLWVIEGPVELAERLPFQQAGLNVIWTNDMSLYRTRKVSLLNGAHTSCVPVAFLYGLDTVAEMVNHPVLGLFTQKTMFDEIIPSMEMDPQMLVDYAHDVLERFKNPYIKHYLISILLNCTSKFKTRVLPSILNYRRKTGFIPLNLSFSLAALIALYRGNLEGNRLKCHRGQEEYFLQDDVKALEYFVQAWAGCGDAQADYLKLTRRILSYKSFWGEDLSERLPGLVEQVSSELYRICQDGIEVAVSDIMANSGL